MIQYWGTYNFNVGPLQQETSRSGRGGSVHNLSFVVDRQGAALSLAIIKGTRVYRIAQDKNAFVVDVGEYESRGNITRGAFYVNNGGWALCTAAMTVGLNVGGPRTCIVYEL